MAFFNKRSSSGTQREETEAARADMEFEFTKKEMILEIKKKSKDLTLTVYFLLDC